MNITKENNLIETQTSIAEFISITRNFSNNSSVLELRKHDQHASISRYKHCLNVAFYTYLICKKLGLDYISATRGAMLHDLYYYDWKSRNGQTPKLHAFTHPRIAFNNATEIFELNKMEKDIILKHMWPLTVIPPKYRESFIVTLVDKYCATFELFMCFKKNRFKKNNHKNL